MKASQKERAIFFVFLSLALFLSSLKNYPIFSDENIYMNMAKFVKNGLFPYQDFFYAHPPLHLLLLASFFCIFGSSFFVVKIYQTIISILILTLTVLISKKFFKNYLFAPIFLLLHPIFLLFNTQAIGFWTSSYFFLISFYLVLKRKESLASLFFSFSLLTRFFSILLFPILFFLSKNKKKLIYFTLLFSFIFLLPLVLKENFVKQTIFYHLKRVTPTLTFDYQYWTFGFFDVFLISLVFLIKNRIFRALAALTLFYQIILILFIKQMIYHYFILTLPLVALLFNFIFSKGNNYFKAFALLLIILNLTSNYKSFDYYFKKENFSVLNEISDFLMNKEIKIIGEPIVTNYVSFKNNLEIVNNMFDTDLKRVNFEGEREFFSSFRHADIIINRKGYFEKFDLFNSLIKDYKVLKEIGDYVVYSKMQKNY